jgi:DHA1 family tetracycline resistance protein-like MFS transporter
MSTTLSPAVSSSTEEKLDFKKVFPIFFVVMVDLLGLTIIIPLLPLYATALLVSPIMIGVLNAAYPLTQMIGAPILGRLSDRYGRKPILLISQIGTLVGFLVLGFANSLAMLLVSRVIDGFSGGNIATAQAMIADSTTEKTRTQGLGLIGAAFGLGFIIGPVIAFVALALTGNNYRAPAFIAAGFSALSIILTAFWLTETHQPHQHTLSNTSNVFKPDIYLRALTHPQVGLLMMLIFMQHFAFGGFENIFPLFSVSRLGLNASGNALVFVFVGIIIVAIQGGLIGKWSRAWGERRLILAGLGLMALGLGLTAATPAQAVPWYSQAQLQAELHEPMQGGEAALNRINAQVKLPDETHKGWAGLIWLLVAMVPASIGGGVLQPSINSLITKRVTSQQRGEMLGASSGLVSAANVIAPLVGYTMFQTIGSSAPLWLWTAILVLLLAAAGQRVKSDPEI